MEKPRGVIALDSSSSSVEVCLVDATNGAIVYKRSEPIIAYSPQEGWCEFDAEEIWEKQERVLREVLELSFEYEILGIGLTNQRETIVAWDRLTHRPFCRAISWSDSRNAFFRERFLEKQEFIRKRTGLYVSEYFSASKMMWILENVAVDKSTLMFGTIDSWLIFKMTEGKKHFTDVSNASRTMCMNLEGECWDRDLLDLFGIPEGSLPQIRPSGSCFGYWEGIPIWGVIGDQQAALLTAGNLNGAVQCTYGTGLFVLMNIGDETEKREGLVTSVGWKIDGETTVHVWENGLFSCGSLLDKLISEGHIRDFNAGECIRRDGVYLEPTGGRFFLFPDNMISPLLENMKIKEGDAVLEYCLNGFALVVRDIVRVMEKGRVGYDCVQLGGQISTIGYLGKIQSLLLGKRVKTFADGNHSVMGAAMLVLLARKMIKWEDLGILLGDAREEDWKTRMYAPEVSYLDGLWSRVKYPI